MARTRRAPTTNLSQSVRGKRYEDVNMRSDTAGAAADDQTAPDSFDLEAEFRTHYARVTSVIARVVNDPARAEELAVDVFMRLWREPNAQGANTPGWLYRTAVRRGLDELRRVTRRARYEPLLRRAGGMPSPEDAAVAGEANAPGIETRPSHAPSASRPGSQLR